MWFETHRFRALFSSVKRIIPRFIWKQDTRSSKKITGHEEHQISMLERATLVVLVGREGVPFWTWAWESFSSFVMENKGTPHFATMKAAPPFKGVHPALLSLPLQKKTLLECCITTCMRCGTIETLWLLGHSNVMGNVKEPFSFVDLLSPQWSYIMCVSSWVDVVPKKSMWWGGFPFSVLLIVPFPCIK